MDNHKLFWIAGVCLKTGIWKIDSPEFKELSAQYSDFPKGYETFLDSGSEMLGAVAFDILSEHLTETDINLDRDYLRALANRLAGAVGISWSEGLDFLRLLIDHSFWSNSAVSNPMQESVREMLAPTEMTGIIFPAAVCGF